jgi:GTP:adenosylcobinamide-phosphate guanylyltransferase
MPRSSNSSPPLRKRGAKNPRWKALRRNIRHHFPLNKDFFLVTGFQGSAFHKRASTSLFDSISNGPGKGHIVKHVTARNSVTLDAIEDAYRKFIAEIEKSNPETRECCIILQFKGQVYETYDDGYDEDLKVQLNKNEWLPISAIFQIFKENSKEYRLSIFIVSNQGHHATRCLIDSTVCTEHEEGSSYAGKSRNVLPEDCIVATTAVNNFNEKDVQRWLEELKRERKWEKGVSILDLLNTYLIHSMCDEMKPQLSVFGDGDVWQYDTHELFKEKLSKARAVTEETVSLVSNSYNFKMVGVRRVAKKIEKHKHADPGGLSLKYCAPASALTLMGCLIDVFGSPQKESSRRRRDTNGVFGLFKRSKRSVDPTPQHQHNR